MKHSKDPFEAAIEVEQEESLPESPVEIEQTLAEDERAVKKCKTSVVSEAKNKDENEEEEQKSNMDKLFKSITGGEKMDDTMNIVVHGIAKMFVGELVETARVVTRERKESGPIISDLAILESPIEDSSSKAKCLKDQFHGFSTKSQITMMGYKSVT